MNRRSALVLSLGFVVTLFAAGCSTTTDPTTTGRASSGSSGSVTGGTPVAGRTIKVVSTTTQLADFSRAVGGSGVEVYGVLKANVDAHDFEPSPADIQAIADADVIVKNGVDLEKWFDKTIEAAQPPGIIVDASEGVTLREGDADHEDEEEGEHEDEASEGPTYDPHIWHNPLNAKIMVANIAKAFERANPEGAASYQVNLDAYTGQLDQLDREIKAQIDGLSNKKLVTNHDAFHYYVDRYGLEFVGSIIPSFDSSAEMSVSEREDLVARIKEQGVKAVFSESSLPPKTADAIAEEAGVKIVQGDDSLHGDSLGPDGSDGATYLDMLRHNTEVIVDNLR